MTTVHFGKETLVGMLLLFLRHFKSDGQEAQISTVLRCLGLKGCVEAAPYRPLGSARRLHIWGEDMHRGDACITSAIFDRYSENRKLNWNLIPLSRLRYRGPHFLEQRTLVVVLLGAKMIDSRVSGHVNASLLRAASMHWPNRKIWTPSQSGNVSHFNPFFRQDHGPRSESVHRSQR